MKEPFTDDTLLARWLSGELTPEEQQQLENHEDFKAWQQIAEVSTTLEPPPFDPKAAYERLAPKLVPQQAKIRRLTIQRSWWAYGIAASILLIVGWFVFLRDTGMTTIQTGTGEYIVQKLPDGSSVELNAASTIQYNQKDWSNNRTLDLRGEAFFKVKNGRTFMVVTDLGEITVLGTSFNVRTRNKALEVGCFTGKVGIVNSLKDTIATLQAGEGILVKRDTLENFALVEDNLPSWVSGTTRFNSTPLYQVLEELERQYDCKVDYDHIEDNRLFSGSFPHEDLPKAVKLICEPMGLQYELEGKEVRIYK